MNLQPWLAPHYPAGLTSLLLLSQIAIVSLMGGGSSYAVITGFATGFVTYDVIKWLTNK